MKETTAIKDTLNHSKDYLKDNASSLYHKSKAQAHDLKVAGSHAIEHSEAHLKLASKQLKAYAKKNPVTTTLIGVGVSFIIAALFSPKK